MIDLFNQAIDRKLRDYEFTNIIKGTVTSVSPLLININDKITITETFIEPKSLGIETFEGATIPLHIGEKLNIVKYNKGQRYYILGKSISSESINYNEVQNKPTLNTNNNNYMNPVPHESIQGTINLHKISKTGSYNDLNSKPPLRLYQISRGVGKNRWVKLASMFKDIGYGKNNFHATLYSTSSYGSNKTGSDIIQMSTRGGISVTATRLSYENNIHNQNKYYYKINENRVELWVLLTKYNYVQELNIHSVEDTAFGILETVETEPEGLVRVLTDDFITESKIKNRYPRYDILENDAIHLKNEDNRKFYALPYYPIGAIYLSLNAENPSRYFGGTWQLIAQGKTLIGVDTTDTDFNRPNLTGGKKTHSHKIKMRMPFDYGGVVGETFKKNGDYGLYDYEKQMYNSEVKVENNITLKPNSNHIKGVSEDRITRTESTIGSTSIDNGLPPYFTCYIWNRIA